MRLIGTIPSKHHAERISAYLMTQEISTHCEEEGAEWQVWVKDEDRLEDAKRFLEEFRQNPDDDRYRKAMDEANKLVRQKEREAQEAKAKQVNITSDRWQAPIHKVAPLTVALVVISCLVTLMTGVGKEKTGETVRALAFCSLSNSQVEEMVDNPIVDPYNTRVRLGSLARGEFWRAITPIFLHWSVFHILFNMYWLVLFGRQIEYRYGTKWMALLVVLIAVPSNISGCMMPENLDGVGIGHLDATFWLVLLGGMSGVNYGLFGYIWMKMTFDSKSNLFVSPGTIMILMIWLLVCMLPDDHQLKQFLQIQNVANWAHGVGLLVGMMIGYAPKLLSDLGVGAKPNAE